MQLKHLWPISQIIQHFLFHLKVRVYALLRYRTIFRVNPHRMQQSTTKMSWKRIMDSYVTHCAWKIYYLTLEPTDVRFYEARIYMNPTGPNKLGFFRLAKDFTMPVQDIE
ncbi:hypothetical protein PanWU01x14_065520 [Parasponia andersonii]|uniref:Uncharacterized protein n=1 Tax=Parasponia andersonii TaxID=3476 RepID=A0A2P5DGW2_PARAD|nr:hypothetical protein PanWU01x14_065520 [Parasponia andersonii]